MNMENKRLTYAQRLKELKKKLKTEEKYLNKKVVYKDRSFASKGEASMFHQLELRKQVGEFLAVTTQQSVYLTKARIQYIADFKCVKQDGSIVYVEFKGVETPVWRIKRKLWSYYGPAPLEIYRMNSRGLFLHETINPKDSENE